jgi:hypothetical protein
LSQVIAFPKTFTARVAQGLTDGTYKAYRVAIGGDGFGLNLTHESCGLCGGFFAPVGFAAVFYTEHADAWFVHEGCLKEASNWTGE